jgi:hypothetical protein
MNFKIAIYLLLVTFFSVGCSDSSQTAITALRIDTQSTTVATATTTQWYSVATYDDGSEKNLTSNVIWNSQDISVAVVDENGSVRSIKSGETTLSATLDIYSNDGNSILRATSKIIVSDADLQSISLLPANSSITEGNSITYQALGTYSGGFTQDITLSSDWNSSDSTIATVTSNGVVSAHKIGEVQIMAFNDGISSETSLVVTSKVLMSISVTPTDGSVDVGKAIIYEAMGSYNDGTEVNITNEVLWSSTKENNAKLLYNSRFLGVLKGNGIILAELDSVQTTRDLEVNLTPGIFLYEQNETNPIADGYEIIEFPYDCNATKDCNSSIESSSIETVVLKRFKMMATDTSHNITNITAIDLNETVQPVLIISNLIDGFLEPGTETIIELRSPRTLSKIVNLQFSFEIDQNRSGYFLENIIYESN